MSTCFFIKLFPAQLLVHSLVSLNDAKEAYKEKKSEVKETLKELNKEDKEERDEAKKELAEAEKNWQDKK